AAEQVRESRVDSVRHARAFVDEPGVKLDHRRAGADMQPRILGAGDSSNADNRDLPAGVRIDVADQLARANQDRTAAESARVRRQDADGLASDGGVARDDSVHAKSKRGFAN